MERKTVVTALSGVLIGGLLLTGGLAFAGDTDNAASNSWAGKIPVVGKLLQGAGGMMKGRGHFRAGGQMLSQDTLDQLVKEEVITQNKADEIKAYIDKLAQERQAQDPGTRPGARQDLFTQLVTNNILTQEQADTIKAKIREIADQQHQQRISDSLKALVEKGTVTQEQADKILKQFAVAEKEREELAQKMENMTLKEIRSYMQNREKPQNPIEQLVSDGVITQEQAGAFYRAMQELAQKQQLERTADSLKGLVEKGTITQEQADKIVKQFENAQKNREALFEKTKNMTPEERRAYMENNRKEFKNPLTQLVTDGVITQKQADAVRKVLPHGGFKAGGFRGGRR